ncbi:type II secretion system protein [Alteromonas sp. ASW11-36]|uniref:Type II secretion system protein n=1 Tax=Alteromonas arenosi TaxID=3055817 RepID=A0ABT7SSI1_9ALTE|nr:type II secretion system protein [Alteromonas sp. ASW11-36]MDM7859136.1 type II secretion system protein [Alteromonas sp. ASW11-36]
MRKVSGFTLIELITTLVILTIVSIGISGFIRSSMGIFADVTEREQLLSDSRFVIERLTRDIRNAVPSSVRVAGNSNVHCLQLVPIDYSTFYLSAPILPSTDTTLEVVEMGDIEGNAYVPAGFGTFAVIFPTRTQDVYDPSQGRRQDVLACSDGGVDASCGTLDDPDNKAQITVDEAFATTSPADRVYFASFAHSYCVRNGGVYFYRTETSPTQPVFTAGGEIMAEFVDNQLSSNPRSQSAGSDDPFRIFDASLLSNASVQIRLRFERNDEVLNYNHEVHVTNVP